MSLICPVFIALCCVHYMILSALLIYIFSHTDITKCCQTPKFDTWRKNKILTWVTVALMIHEDHLQNCPVKESSVSPFDSEFYSFCAKNILIFLVLLLSLHTSYDISCVSVQCKPLRHTCLWWSGCVKEGTAELHE